MKIELLMFVRDGQYTLQTNNKNKQITSILCRNYNGLVENN